MEDYFLTFSRMIQELVAHDAVTVESARITRNEGFALARLGHLAGGHGVTVAQPVVEFFREVEALELEWHFDDGEHLRIDGSIQIPGIPPAWSGAPSAPLWQELLGVRESIPLIVGQKRYYPVDYVRTDTVSSVGCLGGPSEMPDALVFMSKPPAISGAGIGMERYLELLRIGRGVLPQRGFGRFPYPKGEEERYWESLRLLFPEVGPEDFDGPSL